ncbi:MAG: hypothetical protein JKY43_06450 [Phycisphaerales bacterium]|nr:hypothetical protein [Phycisphaerales bacterium]
MKSIHQLGVLFVVCFSSAMAMGQGQSILDTPHNLSAGGSGPVRAATEAQVCIFCHTSHNASLIQPLWNRYLPVSAYSVYTSSSLDANPGQPTGSSKMCLSCHDGTIAVGSVISRDQNIQMSAGITTLPPGSSNLGTDLSDDHPISFPYDTLLLPNNPHLIDPNLLPPEVKLDANSELQCTTCHDVHDNSFGDFLVMDNTDSALCYTCHQMPITSVAAHNECSSCHQPHTSPSGPYLLTADGITATCLTCHNFLLSESNIQADIQKFSTHNITGSVLDTLSSGPSGGQVSCTDCHDPHSMMPGTAEAPVIHPSLGQVSGINASGAWITKASAEYEVCFKCHGDQPAGIPPYVSRQITQSNTRLEFASSAVSSHPIVGPGYNSNVPSLKPGWTESSVMHCSDCHGSDTSKLAGGSGPNGVHGSNEEPLLIARYETADNTPESALAYALCYTCHWRDGNDGILSDRSFPHSSHLKQNISCAACHDSHGISSSQGNLINNSHLINFDTSIVFPDQITGFLKYESLGIFSGQCYMSCHGENHSAKEYAQ